MKLKRNTLIFILLLYLTVNLILFSDEIKQEIIYSLILWCKSLIPSIFPYLIISQMLSMVIEKNIFIKIIKNIFSISSKSASVYVCSLFCGYPSGAINTYNLYKDGIINKEEAQRLLYFTNNPAPLFLITYVGGETLKNTFDGLMIYLIVTLSAFIFGIATRKKTNTYDKPLITNPKIDFSKVCQNAVNALFNICTYVVIGAVIGKIITMNLTIIFKSVDDTVIKIIIYPFIEMTNAINVIGEITNENIRFYLLCVSASFGGLSVFFQILSATQFNFSLSKIIKSKFICATISMILAFIYKNSNIIFTINSDLHIIIQISTIVALILFTLYVTKKIMLKSRKRKIPN